MKITKEKLEKIIEEEILYVLNEKVELTGIIIKFNANQPGSGHAAEAESTEWLGKSPFKVRDIVIPGNPASGSAIPTKQEEEIWNMLVNAMYQRLSQQGIKDEDMNISMPIIVISEDPSKFPAGANEVHMEWDKASVGDSLLNPEFKLQYKKGVDPTKRGRGTSPWFSPIAERSINEGPAGGTGQFRALKAGLLGGGVDKDFANIKDPIARKVLCILVGMLGDDDIKGCV